MVFRHEVISNKALNSKFNLIRFKSENNKFVYKIGQFVMVKIKDGIFRCYSVVGTPDELPFWEVFVDITPGGVGTTYLKSLRPGQSVETLSASGHFLLNDKLKNYVFGATGCGIAPFLPMVKKLVADKICNIYVYWGLRNENDIALNNLFESYSKFNKKFHFEIILSKPGCGWKGKTGHITNEMLKKTKELFDKDTGIYLSGGSKFIVEANKLLLKQQFSPHKIYQETCY